MDSQNILDALKLFLNPLDVAFFLCLIIGLILGIKKGFSEMFFNFIKNLFVLTVTLNYLYPLTDIFKEKVFFSYETTLCVVFSTAGLLLYIVLTLLFFLLKKLLEINWADPFHTLFGAALGMLNASVLLSFFLLFFTFLPSQFFLRSIYKGSYSGNSIARVLVFVHNSAFTLIPSASGFDRERFWNEIDMRLGEEKGNLKKENKDS